MTKKDETVKDETPWAKPAEEKKIVDGVFVDDYPENEPVVADVVPTPDPVL